MKKFDEKKALLLLEDGTILNGVGYGAIGEVIGELVFNTAMTGYVEMLTDPSYAGQILMMTYPHMGNYGVNIKDFESEKIQVKGFVARHICQKPSNWRSQKSLDQFLAEEGIPSIEGIDTRMLTKKSRIHGTMKAMLKVYNSNESININQIKNDLKKYPDISKINFINKIKKNTVRNIKSTGKFKVILIDCGVKNSIINQLTSRGVDVKIVPYDYPPKKILKENPDGVFISNGPGNPKIVKSTIKSIKELVNRIPIGGICLGLQLIALSAGAETFKLKFGHRGSNQPVKDLSSGRVFISTQNHGFAVDSDSIKNTDLEITQINLNDNTIEGLANKDSSVIAVQYHPEASPGPHDTHEFFDKFIEILSK